MKYIFKDNRGSTIIEAAIYFPIILIMVVGIFIVGIYKLDKMCEMTYASKLSADMQSIQDKDGYEGINSMWDMCSSGVNARYVYDNSIFKWTNVSQQNIYFQDKSTPCKLIHMKYSATPMMGRSFTFVPRTNSVCGFIVENNPVDMKDVLVDVRFFCSTNEYGTAFFSKTGYAYGDYLRLQYGR